MKLLWTYTLRIVGSLACILALNVAHANPLDTPNTYIKGVLHGDLAKEIAVLIDQAYIDGTKPKIKAEIVNDSFTLAFHLSMAQRVTLQYLRNYEDVYLEPGETLHIEGQANSFYFSFQFKGKSAANNDFLRAFKQRYQLYHVSFEYFRYKKGIRWYRVHRDMDTEMRQQSPESFLSYMTTRRDSMMLMLNEYERYGELTETFKMFMWSEIHYYWSYHLLTYGYAFGYMHSVNFQDFFDFMYQVPIQNERTLGSKYYRDYVVGAINYHCEGPEKIPSPDDKLDEQLLKQYQYGEEHLNGQVKAFFLSETLKEAFSKNAIYGMMPTYEAFLEENPYPSFSKKVE